MEAGYSVKVVPLRANLVQFRASPPKIMKFEITKEFCEWAAKLEEGCEVSTGLPREKSLAKLRSLPKFNATVLIAPPNNPSQG